MISIANLINQYEPLSKKWNNTGIETGELKNRKYRILQLTKWQRDVDKLFYEMATSGTFDCIKIPEMPKHGGALLLKHEVEVAMIEIEMAKIEESASKLWQTMQSLLKINRKNSTYRKIPKRKIRELERETCAICYEQHNISQIVTIGSCGHSFGKPCFTNIIEHSYDEGKEITCPCCRNHQIDMIRYRK